MAAEECRTTAYELKALSTYLKGRYKVLKDLRLMRMQLMVEELGEVAHALGLTDEVNLLDGLADLTYVVVGTAVAYDMPLSEGFMEVHRSNMTKDFKNDDHAFGKKGKGEQFSPPDLKGVLDLYKIAKGE